MKSSLLVFALCVSTGCVCLIPDYAANRQINHLSRKIEYRVWSSAFRYQPLWRNEKECHTVFFAVVTQGARTRMRIDSVEEPYQVLDWSWSKEYYTPIGKERTVRFEFLKFDGSLIVEKTLSVVCYDRKRAIKDLQMQGWIIE